VPNVVSKDVPKQTLHMLTVEDINVEESDESKSPLTSVFRNVPFLHRQNAGDWVEGNNFLEEVESAVTERVVWEVGHSSCARPGDDGDEQDTEDDCSLDAVHHQQNCEKTAAENADPHGWAPHLGSVGAKASVRVPQSNRASSKLKRSGSGTSDQTNTSRVRKTDDGEVKTDTDSSGKFDAGWNGSCKPLADTENGKTNEDETFNEDSGESNLVGDHAWILIST